MPFTFNGSSWSGKPILYDDRLAGVTFYAYYPYQPEMTGKRKEMPDNDNQKSPNATKQLFRIGHLWKIRAEIQKNTPIRFFLSPGFC